MDEYTVTSYSSSAEKILIKISPPARFVLQHKRWIILVLLYGATTEMMQPRSATAPGTSDQIAPWIPVWFMI